MILTRKRLTIFALLCSLLIVVGLTAPSADAAGKTNKLLGVGISAKAKQVQKKAELNTPGNFKVKFEVEWTDEDTQKQLEKEGWDFSYSLKDGKNKILVKDFNPSKGAVYAVKNDKSKYKIVVTAKKEGEKTQTITSEIVAAYKFLAAPKSLSAKCKKNNNDVKLSWKRVSGASGYAIYRSTSKKIPKKAIKVVSGANKLKYTDTNVPGRHTYRYWVRAIYKGKNHKVAYSTASPSSNADSTLVKRYLTCKIRTMTWYAKMKKTAVVYKTRKGNATKPFKIKKGTIVTVTKKQPKKIPFYKRPTRVYVIQKKNGKVVHKGWVRYGTVGAIKPQNSYDKKVKKSFDWPKAKKEAYINGKKFGSRTRYLIWVNQYTQRVNFFKGHKGHWKLYRVNRCVTGGFLQPTGNSTHYYLKSHKPRRDKYTKAMGHYYYTHLTSFTANSFHTVCYQLGTNKVVADVWNNLKPTTKGCVRLRRGVAKYVYYKLPLGSKVIIY